MNYKINTKKQGEKGEKGNSRGQENCIINNIKFRINKTKEL